MSQRMKKLTIALPEDVWLRLQQEGFKKGVGIGTHLSRLIIARDERQQHKAVPENTPVSGNAGD